MRPLFFILALLFVFWGIISSMAIVSFISKHGVKINFLLLKLLLPKYADQYRKMTLEENGKTGFWYYSFVVSMILAFVLAVIGIFLKD